MANTLLREREQEQQTLEISLPLSEKQLKKKRTFMTVLVILGLIFMGIGILKPGPFQDASTSTTPAALTPPKAPSGPGVPVAVNMGMPGATNSITNLQGPLTAPEVKEFTLVAKNAIVNLGGGTQVAAWTFNGQAPGPTLRAQQGDLMIVHIVNHLNFGISVHWHGIDVPNSEDGVAGLTQDAIKPGQTYTYRFIVDEPGTYWYHSHQFGYEETVGGLFGMLIVDPKTPTIHADVDYSVALHEWNGTDGQSIFSINDSTQTLNKIARPGQWVRLRVVETSNTDTGDPHLFTLLGAPFQVVSTDGHDVNAPQWLTETPIPIGTAQRYDLFFQMPTKGTVALVTSNPEDYQHYQKAPAIVFGQGNVPSKLPSVKSWFDLTTYGQPLPNQLTLQSHFDVNSTIVLDNQMGTSLGRSGMTYTMNGRVFPYTGMIMVKEGQLVKIHFQNNSDLYHPIHLHGHIFTVLAHNGRPLTGSPIRLDTVLVPPHSNYDIAFVANNPGLWMIHCHNFLHANWGMDMMVMYAGYSTPFTVGTQSGNFPD